MTHLINRLEFEVNCPDEGHALNLRQNFSATLGPEIAGVIDQVCSKYAAADEWILIDKIEIDLGSFTSHSMDAQFIESFSRKFEEQVKQKIPVSIPGLTIQAAQFPQFELLKHIVINGSLPWWATARTIDIDALVDEILNTEPERFKEFLFIQRFNKRAWRRLAFQHENKILGRIINLFGELEVAREEILRTHWTNKTFEIGVTTNPERLITLTDQMIVLAAPSLFQSSISISSQVIKKIIGSTDHVLKVQTWSEEEYFQVLAEFDPFVLPGISDSGSDNIISKEYFDEGITNYDESTTLDEKYITRHAGIVLVVPFLKPFFQKLNLIEGKKWKNTYSLSKAIYLLKFMETGELKHAEHELVLEKLICGLPLTDAVFGNIRIEEAEVDEANALLNSVIEHWKALRNTSINGLRENFFKRDGIILKKENGWELQVERKTHDVLLDSIPWGFSTLMLPWNSYMIQVGW